MKKIIGIILILLFPLMIYGQDTIHVNKFHYGFEVTSVLLPQLIDYNIQKNERSIGVGCNGIINYNINNTWAILVNPGLYIGNHNFIAGQTPDVLTLPVKQYQFDIQFHMYSFPIMLQYLIYERSQFSFYIKAGISTDYKIITRYHVKVFENNTYSSETSWNYSSLPFSYWLDGSNFWNTGAKCSAGINYSITKRKQLLLTIEYLIGGHQDVTQRGDYSSDKYFFIKIGGLIN